MPATANGEHEPVVPRKIHRADDVRCARTTGDEGGVLVDHGIPDPARAFVPIALRKQNLATEAALQLFDFHPLQVRHDLLLC